MDLKYLITGTGRCGTVFLARFLTSAGIFCGHETIFDYQGIEAARHRLSNKDMLALSLCSTIKFNPELDDYDHINWHPDIQGIESDASYMAAPFLNEDILKNTKIIHVVRDPLNVIHSFCNNLNYFQNEYSNNKYENFIYEIISELKNTMPQYDRAALYYIKWNQMIQRSNPSFFFKIENDPIEILKFLGKSNTSNFSEKNVNVFRKFKDNIFDDYDQIKSSKIKDDLMKMSSEYGYLKKIFM